MDPALAAVHGAFRSEYGRTVAILVRMLGDLAAAEDAVQEAFTAAAATWPRHGVPPNPQAWIVTTARHRAIDRIRRTKTEARMLPQVVVDEAAPAPAEDDELRMVLLCAHPSLSAATQVALTLRFVGGLTVPEIARAFGTTEESVAQRLTRAKRKIREARIGMPEPGHLRERLGVVLTVVYAIGNEGYLATAGGLRRRDLAQEGIRLARLLLGHCGDDPEARGLLALLLLLDARRRARVTQDGALAPLPEQDRSQWDRAQIAEGQALVRECLAAGRPGPYQLQAAIQAVHCDAASDADTDWGQILALYDHLLRLLPTASVRTARLVAVAQVHGAAVALRETDAATRDHYELALRADLLAATGQLDAAAAAFCQAAELTGNEVERDHLVRRARQVQHETKPPEAQGMNPSD